MKSVEILAFLFMCLFLSEEHTVRNSCMFPLEPQIWYHRSLDTRIYKTDIQFLAVLGSQGYREKIQTAISMLGHFFMFSWPDKEFNIF